MKIHPYSNCLFYLAKSKTPESITEDNTTGEAYFAALGPTDKDSLAKSQWGGLCRKRVHTTSLRMLFLEKSACKFVPWMTSEDLDLGRIPPTS